MMSILFVLLAFASAECSQFYLQAENFRTKGKIINHRNASGNKAVYLKSGQKHQMFFCLQKESKVSLRELRYLDDGKPKTVVIHMDGTYLGVMTTDNKAIGKIRSKYSSFKGVGEQMTLSRGRHVLRVQVTNGDRHGVNIDMAELDIEDLDLTKEAFTCKSFCYTEIPFSSNMYSVFKDTVGPAKALQKSYPTKCAEADNVKIMLFHENIRKYRIRARHPGYHTLANQREPDFNKCHFSTRILWEVKGIKFAKKKFKYVDKTVMLDLVKKHSLAVEMTANFKVQGREEGMNDHDVGALLTVSLVNVRSGIFISVVVQGRNGIWDNIGTKYIKKGNSSNLTWDISDYTWAEKKENILKIVFIGDNVNSASVSSVKLEKRFLKGDRSFSIFNDNNVIIEGVDIDMWWLKDGMSITIEGEDMSWTAHYFRMYAPVPWAEGFSQTFVMYQDGNVRLLPYTPHGADWIPFGSSVLIGQVNSSSLRPAAEITHVHINPEAQEFTVHYKDGGIALVTMESTMDETIAHVKVLKLGRDPAIFPFVSFRSMWVKDGNADVDHVSSNGRKGHHILDPWGMLYGYSFTFYRSCISRHNTQSPDINIEVME